MQQATDEYLMTCFRNRQDPRSLEELTERYTGKALGVARHYLFDANASEDAVQETFCKVARHAGRYSPGSAFSPWFFRMLRNVCLDMLRKKKIHQQYVERFGPDIPDFDAEQTGSLDNHATSLLAKLPQQEREVLVMKIVNDMPFADIAAATGSSVEAAKKRSQRGLRRLRELYEHTLKMEAVQTYGRP
jgi:RNA polymerase sigma-70 factor (ECF subfamily)